MLIIQDLNTNMEGLVDFKNLNRNRKVNGEKTLSLEVLPTKNNLHAFEMVEEESIITFDNEEYVIKKLAERGIGNTYIKRVEAAHKFYNDMKNKQQPKIHNGSMTFLAFLQFVFEGTGYTFSIIDSFYAQSFENLGNDNRLSLLQKGLERYMAEMEIVGNNVRFKKMIGNDTDFQFRYGHNINTIDRKADTPNLATVIKGKGAEGITATYRSPNADIFGEIDAPPVEDERFTTQETLLEEMKARLQDTPEISLTIDFSELRANGYPYTVPNEGDRVFVIYEPMKDLMIEARIMEVDEVFDANLNVIKTNVTLANYKKTFHGTMFDNIQKALRSITNEDGVIKYSVLDEAVRVATEALQSAQTELEFQNGIIAREKTNPNKIVVYNSAGLGISTDGGNSFKTAITADGIVAESIIGGSIIGVNLMSMDEGGIFHVSGADAEFINTSNNRRVKINPDGLFGYNSNDTIRFQANQTLVTSSAFGTSVQNVYLASYGEARVVNYDDIPGDGQVGSYRYLPLRASNLFADSLDVNQGTNMYLRTYSNGEVRITNVGSTTAYRALRASNFYGDSIDTNIGTALYLRAPSNGEVRTTVNGSTTAYIPMRASNYFGDSLDANVGPNVYVRPFSNGEVRITNSGSTSSYRPLRAANLFADSLDANVGTNVYIRPSSSGVVRITASNTTDNFRPIEASEFNVSSSQYLKKNIEDYIGNALELINNTPVRQYHLLEDVEEVDPKRIGLVVQESPVEVVNIKGGESNNIYSMASLLWKAVQELSSENKELRTRVKNLEGAL